MKALSIAARSVSVASAIGALIISAYTFSAVIALHDRADKSSLPRGCVIGYVMQMIGDKPVLLPVQLCSNTKEA
jgi:hypothetical protein